MSQVSSNDDHSAHGALDSKQNCDGASKCHNLSPPEPEDFEYCDMPIIEQIRPASKFFDEERVSNVNTVKGSLYIRTLQELDSMIEAERRILQGVPMAFKVLIDALVRKAISTRESDTGIDSLAHILSYLLPHWAREEWLGDFREDISELSESTSSRWKVRMVVLGKVLVMLFALARIRIQDLVSPRKKRTLE